MRRVHKTVSVLLLSVLILGVIATACAPSPPPAAPAQSQESAATEAVEVELMEEESKDGGTLNIAIAEDPKALDTLRDPGTEGDYVLEQIAEGLLHLTDEGEIVPELAESMPEIPDDTTYIFKLREGVKFHNGTELDAEDVKWSFDTVLDEESGSAMYAWYGQYLDNVEVLDKYTVQFNMKRPWPDFLGVLATKVYGYIKSPEAFDEYGEDYGTKAVVGTGPFKFVEWVRGDHITLERNPDYWDPEGVPHLERVVFKPITEASTRLIGFRAGELDVLFGVPFKDVDDLREDPDVEVEAHEGATIVQLITNTRDPVFKDKRVRQALSLAVDRAAIRDIVFSGLATVADSNFPSWHWAHMDDLEPFEYSPDKAKELLAEAGYDESNPLKFKLTTTAVTEFVDTAVLVQSQLAEIGVEAEIEQIEKSALGNLFSSPDLWQVLLYRFILGLPTADYTWRTHNSQSALDIPYYNKEGGYQHPEVDELLDEADTTVDQERAEELLHEISLALREDMPYVPLVWLPTITAYHGYVEELPVYVWYQVNLNDVWLDK